MCRPRFGSRHGSRRCFAEAKAAGAFEGADIWCWSSCSWRYCRGCCLASDIQEYAEAYARLALQEFMRSAGEPVAWMSPESRTRLRAGGNSSRGTVPVHGRPSRAATIALSMLPVVSDDAPVA